MLGRGEMVDVYLRCYEMHSLKARIDALREAAVICDFDEVVLQHLALNVSYLVLARGTVMA